MRDFLKPVFLLAVLIGFSTHALAHSQVTGTGPENGAVLTEIPASIDLNFSGKVRLTRVTVQREEQAPRDLDPSGSKGFADRFSFPNISTGTGHYTIEWRGLGTDGHVLQGAFSFTVE